MIFPSTLVISADRSSIETFVSDFLQQCGHQSVLNNPDIFLISQEGEYTIANIRLLQKFSSQKPYSHDSKIVIIYHAELLNAESQNALLKSLEEPLDNNYFLLVTASPSALLNTIISRMHLVRLLPLNHAATEKILDFPQQITDSLMLAETLSYDKAHLKNLIDQQISLYQKQLALAPNLTTTQKIQKLIKCAQMLQANVEPKAALDFLFLT